MVSGGMSWPGWRLLGGAAQTAPRQWTWRASMASSLRTIEEMWHRWAWSCRLRRGRRCVSRRLRPSASGRFWRVAGADWGLARSGLFAGGDAWLLATHLCQAFRHERQSAWFEGREGVRVFWWHDHRGAVRQCPGAGGPGRCGSINVFTPLPTTGASNHGPARRSGRGLRQARGGLRQGECHRQAQGCQLGSFGCASCRVDVGDRGLLHQRHDRRTAN